MPGAAGLASPAGASVLGVWANASAGAHTSAANHQAPTPARHPSTPLKRAAELGAPRACRPDALAWPGRQCKPVALPGDSARVRRGESGPGRAGSFRHRVPLGHQEDPATERRTRRAEGCARFRVERRLQTESHRLEQPDQLGDAVHPDRLPSAGPSQPDRPRTRWSPPCPRPDRTEVARGGAFRPAAGGPGPNPGRAGQRGRPGASSRRPPDRPGVTAAARVARMAASSASVPYPSELKRLSATSNPVSPLRGRRRSCRRYRSRSGPRSPRWLSAWPSSAADWSTPRTCAPIRASGRATRPKPHPPSSTRQPSPRPRIRHSAAAWSSPECRHLAEQTEVLPVEELFPPGRRRSFQRTGATQSSRERSSLRWSWSVSGALFPSISKNSPSLVQLLLPLLDVDGGGLVDLLRGDVAARRGRGRRPWAPSRTASPGRRRVTCARSTIHFSTRMFSPKPGQRNLPSLPFRNQFTWKILGG